MSVHNVAKAGAILAHSTAIAIDLFVLGTSKDPSQRRKASEALKEDAKNLQDTFNNKMPS